MAGLEQHGQQMGILAGTTLRMCLKPQQIAEMNTPHWQESLPRREHSKGRAVPLLGWTYPKVQI